MYNALAPGGSSFFARAWLYKGEAMGKAEEKRFFDKSFAEQTRRPLYRYYALMRNSEEKYRERIYGDCAGRKVLEYGCGVGSHAFRLAENGADVTGIDISSVAIAKAGERARELGLTNVGFEEMDAESMAFPSETFDMVVGTAILHHLDLPIAMNELARIMRPGGRAVFMEPLAHNPALRIFRNLTPRWRTEDEHPLTRGDIDLMRRRFRKVRLWHFHLTSFLSLLLLRTRIFWPVYDALEKVDRGLFKLVPPLASWSWYVVIELSEPRPVESDPEVA